MVLQLDLDVLETNVCKVGFSSTPNLFSRSVLSAGDLQCSMGASAAHIAVTTAQGQVKVKYLVVAEVFNPGP